MTQFHFAVPKHDKLNCRPFLIMKIPNKRKLPKIAFNHSSDIDFEDFMNLYINCTAKTYSFLVNDNTLVSDNPLHFRKKPLERI